MITKANVALSRSQNGDLYFQKKKRMNRPVAELFNRKQFYEEDSMLRHLDLGTIKLEFYNELTKKSVTHIDITTPFIINAYCYDSTTGQFTPNNNASKLFRWKIYNLSIRIYDNRDVLLDILKEVCHSKGLEEQYLFLTKQVDSYQSGNLDWFQSEPDESKCVSNNLNRSFYTRMKNRYEHTTGKKFTLNANLQNYIGVMNKANRKKVEKMSRHEADTFIQSISNWSMLDAEMLKDHFLDYYRSYPSNSKYRLSVPKKPSKIQKMLGSVLRWTGIQGTRGPIEVSTFEEHIEDENKEINYKIIPGILNDYSLLSKLELSTVPTDLWVEFFNLNRYVPPFLVPLETRKLFTEDQLEEIVKIAPRIIIEWNMPELYNETRNIELFEVYPLMTLEQKTDLKNIALIGYSNRHLVPEIQTKFTSIPEFFTEHYMLIDEIYDLLSEELQEQLWSQVRLQRNLLQIPMKTVTEQTYRDLLIHCLKTNKIRTFYLSPRSGMVKSVKIEELPSIYSQDAQRLFNTCVNIVDSNPDIDRVYCDMDISLELMGISKCLAPLDKDVFEAAELTMYEDHIVIFNQQTISEYKKTLHYRQLDSIVPQKTDTIPPKRRKI